MPKLCCVVTVCMIVLAATSALADDQVLDSNLALFEDLIGKQWEGHFENVDEPMTLYMKWEPIIGGAAIQMSGSSSTTDMTRRNIYYFDRAKKQVAFLAMTSNGYVATGTVTSEDSALVFVGKQTWPDGSVHDTESRWVFLPDGSIRALAGHSILFTPVKPK